MSDENPKSGEQLLDKHYFHEADRMNQRTDWFLIFHAILMEAFFSSSSKDPNSPLVLGSLGYVLSWLWLISGIRANRMQWHLGLLIRTDLEKGASLMHKRIFRQRRQIVDTNSVYGWSRFLPLFGVVIPAIFVIAWLILILIRYPADWLCVMTIILVLTVLAIIVIAFAITKWIEPAVKKPSIDEFRSSEFAKPETEDV